MSCVSDFNGCSETTSDKCVKYTGLDIPLLGINNGDSLLTIESALITYVLSLISGTGMKINIAPSVICNLVRQHLPVCVGVTPLANCVITTNDLTAKNLFTALIKVVCSLQEQIDQLNLKFVELEADYNIRCLSGVVNSSNTHVVLQSVIDSLCSTKVSFDQLLLNLNSDFVRANQLNSIIESYLNSRPNITKLFNRMVPFTVVEYYGNLNNFNVSGAGIGDYQQIYLCNGNNGTPDKRGRSPIGATIVNGGGPFSSTVDPTLPGNPSYTIGTMHGANTVVLSTLQIPFHTHNNTVTIADPGHTHNISFKKGQADQNESGMSGELFDNAPTYNRTKTTQSTMTGISANITNASSGGGLAHSNIHPVLACYYIMYIPN